MGKVNRATAGVVGAALLCLAVNGYGEPERASAAVLSTITVTGEKVERSLRDTTASVSVINAEKLDGVQYNSVNEVVAEVSNVVVTSGSVPDIRGVSGNGAAGGFNSITGGANPRVSTLIDGVAEPFVADLTGDSGLWDVEQIEVFRGPQSTSNGRSSIGGAIVITTRDPSFAWEAAGRAGYRNQDQYIDTSAMVSGPLLDDRLAFRLTAQRLDAQTITDDQEFPANPADYDLNEALTERVRGKLLWVPAAGLEALLTYSSNNESGDTGRIYYTADDPWAFNRLYFRDIETDSATTSLKLSYQFNTLVAVDLLAAHIDYQWGFDSYEPDPADQQQLVFDEEDDSLDLRIHIGNRAHRVSGFLALAYFERSQTFTSSGGTIYAGDDESDSRALYGEFTFAISDALRLVLGNRLQRENQRRNFDYNNGAIVSLLDESETINLPKLALLYDWSPHTTLGISARKGYSSPGGALNFAAAEYYYFDEETVTTYEASARSDLNNAVSLSANVFYNEYEGYQALSSTRFITNMDEVVTYGAELEGLTSIGQDLELSAGLGWLRSEIKEAGAGYSEANGNELNSAPEITANLSASYWLTASLSVTAAAHYVDEYFGDFNNTEARVAGNYTLVNLSSRYQSGPWLVSAFANNVTDKQAFVLREPPSGRFPTGYVDVVEPRHVGISVTYSL